jgi:hypothetical protein
MNPPVVVGRVAPRATDGPTPSSMFSKNSASIWKDSP